MPNSPLVQFLLILVLAGCGFGVWKGDIPERLGALVILLNAALSVLLGQVLDSELSYLAGLVLDGLTALAFLAMTVASGRAWLGVAMLIYAGQFALRSYYLVMARPRDQLHAVVNNANFMAITGCIVIGTLIAWGRRRRRAPRTA